MAEYGGSYPGAYLLRRGLYLPFELAGLMDPEIAHEGLARLSPLARIAASIAPDPGSAVGRVAALESCNYMRNQLLRDSDWAGMAHSLEIRTPLVDFQMLRQLAPVIPALRPGAGKRALARAPSRPLPEVVAQRAKTGFGVPVGHWLAAGSAGKGAVSRAWGREVLASAHALAGDFSLKATG
jgi:asparagine synthase (glutamine-hydrolysing)